MISLQWHSICNSPSMRKRSTLWLAALRCTAVQRNQLASVPRLTHKLGAATQGIVSRNALRQTGHTARSLHISAASGCADRGDRWADSAGLADPVAAFRRAGGE